MQAPLHIRRSQLKSSTEPVIKVMFTNADQLTTSKMTELRKHIQLEKPLLLQFVKSNPKILKKSMITKSQDTLSTL